jgi:hypothetical protein
MSEPFAHRHCGGNAVQSAEAVARLLHTHLARRQFEPPLAPADGDFIPCWDFDILQMTRHPATNTPYLGCQDADIIIQVVTVDDIGDYHYVDLWTLVVRKPVIRLNAPQERAHCLSDTSSFPYLVEVIRCWSGE